MRGVEDVLSIKKAHYSDKKVFQNSRGVSEVEISRNGEDLILSGQDSFELSHIFDCGQCFRWSENPDKSFTGIVFGKALTISSENGIITFKNTSTEDFENIWRRYFDLDTDYSKIKEKLSSDSVLKNAIGYGGGIRILKQDLWECVVSFIISASNNIPRIKKIIDALCRNFGEKIEYMGNEYFTFPTPEKISSLNLEDLGIIKAGFRDKYIMDAARKFSDGEISESKLSGLSTADAKSALMTIKGVGNKVADCVLLFGLSRCESFPVDVWIKRIMEYCYFDNKQTIGNISLFSREKFSDLGGYAQQYLFFYARENKIGF